MSLLQGEASGSFHPLCPLPLTTGLSALAAFLASTPAPSPAHPGSAVSVQMLAKASLEGVGPQANSFQGHLNHPKSSHPFSPISCYSMNGICNGQQEQSLCQATLLELGPIDQEPGQAHRCEFLDLGGIWLNPCEEQLRAEVEKCTP